MRVVSTQAGSTNCTRCGAAVTQSSAGSCTTCGSELSSTRARLLGGARPSLEQRGLSSSAGLRVLPRERLAALHRHAEYAAWMRAEPAVTAQTVPLVITTALGLTIAGLEFGGRAGHSLPRVTSLALGSAGLALAGAMIFLLVRFLRAPLARRAAIVRCERSEVRATRQGRRTSRFVTLEYEDGTQREFSVTRAIADAVETDDVGIAYEKDMVLIAFQKAC